MQHATLQHATKVKRRFSREPERTSATALYNLKLESQTRIPDKDLRR